MKRILLISILLTFAACKQQPQHKDTGSTDTSSLDRPIEVTEEQVNLLPEAREQAVQWLSYITAQNEINNLRESTLRKIVENSAPLVQIMQSLKTSIPDTLKTNAVQARVNVLVTKAQVLRQLSTQRELNPDAIAKTAGEIPSDFNNFKLQLNEIYLKTIEDFEKELDKLEKEEKQDSARSPREPKPLNQDSLLKPTD